MSAAKAPPPASSMRPRGRFAPLLLLVLAGCWGGKYPSLARRPAETRAQPASDSPAPVVPATADPRLAGRVAHLLEQARAGHRAFLARGEEAAGLIARAGSAPGNDAPLSENWAAAQQALSALDAARGGTSAALGEIEELYTADRVAHAIEDANAGSATVRPDAATLAAARAELLDLSDSEDALLAGLKARLPG